MDLKKLTQTFIKIEDGAIIVGIVLTVAATFINVVARYIFKTGFGWSEELVRYLMIWVSFIGLGIGIRKQNHIVVDFFVEKVFGSNTVGRKWANRVGYSIACFFCLFLFVSSLILTFNVFQQEQISAGLEIPMGIIYALLPVACFVSTIRYFTITLKGEGDEKKYWE